MVLDMLLKVLDNVLDVDGKLIAGVELQGVVNGALRGRDSAGWRSPHRRELPYPQRRQGHRLRVATHPRALPA